MRTCWHFWRWRHRHQGGTHCMPCCVYRPYQKMFRISDRTRKARAGLRAARRELARVSDRDRCESDAYLAANSRVIAAEQRLPWWKRLDIDLTVVSK